MKEYTIRVLFYTGFNPFYDKIIRRVSVMAKSKEEALNKVKEIYPSATNEMVKSCGIECFVMGRWKNELKYEFIEE